MRRKVSALALIVLVLVVGSTLPVKASNLEPVFVYRVFDTDYKTIVVRKNGDAYLLEYGVGVISLWRYEGKTVSIYSPGLFAGIGSRIIIPDVKQEARIWSSELIGHLNLNTPPVLQPPIKEPQPNSHPDIRIFVNGHPLLLDVAPMLRAGRLLVPLRCISEELGATVNWDGEKQQIDITLNTTSVRLWVGRTNAIVNGKDTFLDVPPQTVNGRTLVPLRFISESLGANVNWDPPSATVTVTTF